MTVFRNNPLLMTVMGANPGPRRKRPVDDPIDHAIGQAWHRLMSGIQVSIMDIPRIFRDVKLEMAAGMPLEEAVMRVGARFQVNRNGYRRNPSFAASLAGGLAGAAVTYAMSNPGPAFIVIDSQSGVVQYRRAATHTGDIAFRACYARAVDMAHKLGRSFLVFLDIGGHKVGARMSLPMVRVQGATEVWPGGGSSQANPLNEAEHRQLIREAKHDRAVGGRYNEKGDQFQHGVYTGRALKALEVAHNFSPRSNPVGVLFSTPAKLEAEKIAGWLAREGVKVTVKPIRGEWGVQVPPNKFGEARHALARVISRNPTYRARYLSPSMEVRQEMIRARGVKSALKKAHQRVEQLPRQFTAPHSSVEVDRIHSNPGPRNGKRKITMTIEQFARWVKAKRDPAMWKAFLAKFRGYEKWTHGAKGRKVTLEWQNVPGMDGLWITYDGGKQPESTYIMRKGSPRKGAWKHEWDTMPDIKHDPEAGLVLNKLRGKSKISDFYHR